MKIIWIADGGRPSEEGHSWQDENRSGALRCVGSGEETSYLPPEELSMASTMLENCGESASRITPH